MDELAFVFPGQGSQFPGMGKSLYKEYSTAKQTFEEADEFLGFKISKICFDGRFLELNNIENMFLAILTVGVALFRVYMEEVGKEPAMLAGHSIGEYTALTASGFLDFRDALSIVRQRGQLVTDNQYAESGTMTVLQDVEKEMVERECNRISQTGKIVEVACYNSDHQIVISGNNSGVLEMENKVISCSGTITPMLMSPPLHSSLMQKAAIKLEEALQKVKINKMKWPVISNYSARYYNGTKADFISNLKNQLIMPVQWKNTLSYMKHKNINTLIEMGERSVLFNLAKNEETNLKSFIFGGKEDKKYLIEFFGKKDNCSHYHKNIIPEALTIAVSTKNYNYNSQEYLEGVIKPYEQMEKIQDELDQKMSHPTKDQIKMVLNYLEQILETKGIPKEEKNMLVESLMNT